MRQERRAEFGRILTSRSWDIVIDTILKDNDLEFAIDALTGRVGHFIHTGSIGVYGDARRIPAPEWLPMAQGDLSEEIVFNDKIAQDQVLMRAFQEKSFPATILRMSNIYGPGDIPLDGWGGRNPLFFRMILEGKTIPLPENGRALLQPGHVKDLGRAFLHAAKRPAIHWTGLQHRWRLEPDAQRLCAASGKNPRTGNQNRIRLSGRTAETLSENQ